MNLLRTQILLFTILFTITVMSCDSRSGSTANEDDLVLFRIGNVTMEPESPVRGDTIVFRAQVLGRQNLISEYRWRIVDVTSHITEDPVYEWVADVRAGGYELEVRPRSNTQADIQSYRFRFDIGE